MSTARAHRTARVAARTRRSIARGDGVEAMMMQRMTRTRARVVRAVAVDAVAVVRIGAASVKGTVRKQNEDRYASWSGNSSGVTTLASVFDGHGGSAVSEWLGEKLHDIILREWVNADFSLDALRNACLKADYELVQPPEGFFAAFGERGVGGAKCGSTAAVVALHEEGGATRLSTANVGDARILLIRDGKAVQLSVDHVPDDENERKRIDRGNPNLRKSLVSFTNGSWRVGGVLALSRAFGDSFLKESGRFEGLGERNADYGSGFGLNAEPDCYIETITPADSWVLVATDGLFENPERGGGGGWRNEEVAEFLNANGSKDPESLAKELVAQAVAKGSTDDVTVQLLRLN